MKIALFGASGMIGQRILNEAIARGHEVTGIVRNPDKMTVTNPKVSVVKADAQNSTDVAHAVKGHDVVINCTSPDHTHPENIIDIAHAFVAGLKDAHVKRLLIVGGAGSLEVAPGMKVFDTPEFPEAWRPLAKAHGSTLAVYSASDLDWTYISPSAMIEPGERTGQFRIGGDQLLTDEQGNSHISCEDYAVALVDEIEKPSAIRRRITVGY